MEQERMKEREAIQNSSYERMMSFYQDWADRQKNGKLVIRFEESDYQASRQGFIKYYLSPLITDTALSTWAVFEQLVKRQSGRHRHQGGIIIYVIEGEGATDVNGEILEWKEGDLLLLPIMPGGSSHQHWNKDVSKGCRWIAFRDMLVAPYIANAIDQLSETPDLDGDTTSSAVGKKYSGWKKQVHGDQPELVTHPDQLNSVNMFDKLLEFRDMQRSRQEQGTWLIRGDELPWELNQHGKMQWYLHPLIAYSSVQTNIFYKQEIPVGSRSGLQKHGGDVVFNILQGEGYTEVNGVRHSWKKNDVMTLPSFPTGVTYRHVNTGKEPVQFIGMERNFTHAVTVDRQSGFEQLQPCPEYRNAAK